MNEEPPKIELQAGQPQTVLMTSSSAQIKPQQQKLANGTRKKKGERASKAHPSKPIKHSIQTTLTIFNCGESKQLPPNPPRAPFLVFLERTAQSHRPLRSRAFLFVSVQVQLNPDQTLSPSVRRKRRSSQRLQSRPLPKWLPSWRFSSATTPSSLTRTRPSSILSKTR